MPALSTPPEASTQTPKEAAQTAPQGKDTNQVWRARLCRAFAALLGMNPSPPKPSNHFQSTPPEEKPARARTDPIGPTEGQIIVLPPPRAVQPASLKRGMGKGHRKGRPPRFGGRDCVELSPPCSAWIPRHPSLESTPTGKDDHPGLEGETVSSFRRLAWHEPLATQASDHFQSAPTGGEKPARARTDPIGSNEG
jgi:hypothetical protein